MLQKLACCGCGGKVFVPQAKPQETWTTCIQPRPEDDTSASGLQVVEEYDAEVLSYVGRAAAEALRSRHPQYREVCWNVTYGRVVGAIAQTPPGDYWKDAQIQEDLETSHSDHFPEKMGEIISRATRWVDFTSLGAPDGKFLSSLAKALKRLSDSGKRVTVRFLTGNIIGMPTDNRKLCEQLTKYPGHELPDDTSIRLWVGAWRKGLSWNHAKIIAVDGKYLFTGGHNVWDPHYLQKNPVRDLSMEAEGQVAEDGHVFANSMWEYIITTSKQEREVKNEPGWLPRVPKGRVGVCSFPPQTGEYPPLYEPASQPMPLPDAVAAGNLPMITMGRYGTLHPSNAAANPSDSAIVAMLKSARKCIKMSLQDLGPLAVPPPMGPMAIPGCIWPKDYLRELACAIYERGVDVHICLSSPCSIPADLNMTEANYGNGWTCEDVATEIVKEIQKNFPDADEQILTGLVGINLRCAYTRGSCGKCDWEDKRKTGNHAKFFIVDDLAYYVGSQNLYIANLAEWGVVVDSKKQTLKVLEEYWKKLWRASYEDVPVEARDMNIDRVLAGRELDRNPKDVAEYTEEELEAALLAQKANKMAGSMNTLTVWVKRASNIRDADHGPFSGTSDAYVNLRVVDGRGRDVAVPRQSRVIPDAGKNPHWNEQFDFEGLEKPGSYTLKLTVLDKDSLFGLGGEIADWLVAEDRLGSATVDLGILKKTHNFQDMELVIDDGWFVDSKISIGLNTRGGWGN